MYCNLIVWNRIFFGSSSLFQFYYGIHFIIKYRLAFSKIPTPFVCPFLFLSVQSSSSSPLFTCCLRSRLLLSPTICQKHIHFQSLNSNNFLSPPSFCVETLTFFMPNTLLAHLSDNIVFSNISSHHIKKNFHILHISPLRIIYNSHIFSFPSTFFPYVFFYSYLT